MCEHSNTDQPVTPSPKEQSLALSPLSKAGIRLETSGASLAGFLGRRDITEIDLANTEHLHNRELFRDQLHQATGMPAGQIERLLNL